MSDEPQLLDPYRSPLAGAAGDPSGTSRRRHSGLGVASFVIGLLTGLGACGLMVVTTAVAYSAAQAGGASVSDAEAFAIALGQPVVVGCCLLGLVLGIVGTFQRSRKRTFAILGIAFNALVILGFCGILGLAFVG